MKIEIVEFYHRKPCKKKNRYIGTLHIFIADFNMDLRGILVEPTKGKFRFTFPHYQGWDTEEKKKVSFPLVNFIDDTFTEIKKFLSVEGNKYVKKKLAENKGAK